MLRKISKIFSHTYIGHNKIYRDRDKENREDSFESSLIKTKDRIGTFFVLSQEYSSYEISRNHEKNIDSDAATRMHL